MSSTTKSYRYHKTVNFLLILKRTYYLISPLRFVSTTLSHTASLERRVVIYIESRTGQNIFSAFTSNSSFIISLHFINLYQFLKLCSSKALLFYTNIYLISLISSGSERLLLANEIDLTHLEFSIRRVLHYPLAIPVLFTQSLLGLSR